MFSSLNTYTLTNALSYATAAWNAYRGAYARLIMCVRVCMKKPTMMLKKAYIFHHYITWNTHPWWMFFLNNRMLKNEYETNMPLFSFYSLIFFLILHVFYWNFTYVCISLLQMFHVHTSIQPLVIGWMMVVVIRMQLLLFQRVAQKSPLAQFLLIVP